MPSQQHVAYIESLPNPVPQDYLFSIGLLCYRAGSQTTTYDLFEGNLFTEHNQTQAIGLCLIVQLQNSIEHTVQ